MIKKNLNFSFNHKDQQDKIYSTMTSQQVKENYDSRGEDLRTYVYKVIDELLSSTGSQNIGYKTGNVYQDLEIKDVKISSCEGKVDKIDTSTKQSVDLLNQKINNDINRTNDKIDSEIYYTNEKINKVDFDLNSFESKYNSQVINVGNSNAEIVDSRTGYKTYDTLGLRVNDVENNSVKYVKASSLNLTSNGSDNLSKFMFYINNGFGIDVDIDCVLDSCSNSVLTKDLNLTSSNNSKITLTNLNVSSAKILFEISTVTQCISINITNLKIHNIGSGMFIIFNNRENSLPYINEFNVKNCSFERISLLRYRPDISVDPSLTKYGITTLSIENNSFKEIYWTLMALADVPYVEFRFRNNRVIDFDYTLVNLGIENSNIYTNYLMNTREVAYFENNYIYCRDEYWGSSGANKGYYCALLCEGKKAIVRGNHVEGLKHTSLSPIYDYYLSSTDVLVENNTWKNNIIFNSGKFDVISLNSLMKAKGAGGQKKYIGNRYIVEKSFATKCSQDISLLRVMMYDIQDDSYLWEIRDNYIEVPYMTLQPASKKVDITKMIGNTIKCEECSSALVIINPYKEGQEAYVNNNNISIDSTNQVTICKTVKTDYKLNLADICDNTIKVDFLSSSIENVNAKTLNLKNNTLILTNSSEVQLTADDYTKDSITCIGNQVIVENGKCRLYRIRPYKNINYECNVMNNTHAINTNEKLTLIKNNEGTYDKERTYRVDIEVTSSGVKKSGYFMFSTLTDTDNLNKVKFKDTSDVDHIYKINSDVILDNEGHNSHIKYYGDLTLDIRFININASTYIYNNISLGYGNMKVTITTS